MTDRKMERIVAAVLRAGVLLAGLVVMLGGIYYLAGHGAQPVDYRVFRPSPIRGARGAGVFSAPALIQLGVLLLIATPILRVAVSLVCFALERDRKYVAIALLVLALLLHSLLTS